MRISDWSSDVCSSDLDDLDAQAIGRHVEQQLRAELTQHGVGLDKKLKIAFQVFEPIQVAAIALGHAIVVSWQWMLVRNNAWRAGGYRRGRRINLGPARDSRHQRHAKVLGNRMQIFMRDRKSTRLNSSH